MFLKIIGTCNSHTVVNAVSVLKKVLSLIQIIGPILSILVLVIIVAKLVTKPKNKKLIKRFKKCISVLVFIFIIPIIINTFLYILDDSFEFSTCWNYDDKEVKLDGKYMNNNRSNYKKDFVESNITKRIFVGDSRTVQMYAYLHDDWQGANYSNGGVHVVGDDIFISESGEGLAWMKNIGIPEALKYMDEGSAVIILMGVNDLYNLNEYINYINTNYSKWTSKGAIVYFDSVNPCSDGYASRLNKNIEIFNNGMKQALNPNIRFLDSHSKLIKSGYNTIDGLHYDSNTSIKIYNFIKNSL